MEKLFSCIILLAIAVLCVPGCIAEETKAVDGENTTLVTATNGTSAIGETEPALMDGVNGTEPVGTDMNTTYTADGNVTALAMMVNETVLIALKENPTTGYLWNVTNSTGLEIISDTYTMDAAKEGMVGVGGIHEWTAKAVLAGNQTFNAVMTHVSEKPAGNEEAYTLAVVVSEKASEKSEEKPVEKV